MATARSSTTQRPSPAAGLGRQRSLTSMQSDRGLPVTAASKKARTLSASSSWTTVEKAFPRSEALS